MNICSLILVFLISFLPELGLYSADGKASYYSDRMHGQRTASGERYDKKQLTAAHATLPFNTMIQVTNVRNGKSVVVRINDRMSYSRHRVIDLSRAAAQQLDLVRDGIASVQLQEVTKGTEGQQESVADVSEIVTSRNR